jgi:hypothetical protein
LPEWIAERGIGETRLARMAEGAIVEARIELDGVVAAGTRLNATLIRAGRIGVARDKAGGEYLLPSGAPGVTEGAPVEIIVTRSAIPGTEPWKRPLARLAGGDKCEEPVEPVAGTMAADWDDLIEEARSGISRLAGGELRLSATPAMTLIDVDGTLPAKELAMAGARAAARAILRLDIGGSIGIDLPTISGKSDREAVGVAFDAFLPKPFERTAMNGFGFVQIVRPRRRASLLELAADRAPFEARALIHRVGREPAGAKRLVAHPAILAALERHPDWLTALARQVGGAVSLRTDAALPMSGGYAEQV